MFISGPTGVGKSALSLLLCEAMDGELISCDSVQLHRGLTIGASKPSPEDLARVRHHCVDAVDLSIGFSDPANDNSTSSSSSAYRSRAGDSTTSSSSSTKSGRGRGSAGSSLSATHGDIDSEVDPGGSLASDVSAGQYLGLARTALADCTSRGKMPVLCGGSGFYARAFLFGLPLTSDGRQCRHEAERVVERARARMAEARKVRSITNGSLVELPRLSFDRCDAPQEAASADSDVLLAVCSVLEEDRGAPLSIDARDYLLSRLSAPSMPVRRLERAVQMLLANDCRPPPPFILPRSVRDARQVLTERWPGLDWRCLFLWSPRIFLCRLSSLSFQNSSIPPCTASFALSCTASNCSVAFSCASCMLLNFNSHAQCLL